MSSLSVRSRGEKKMTMLLSCILIFVYTLMFISLLLNTLGMYCLYKESGGIKKQRLLLINLSLIEIIKAVYDYIPLTTYHYAEKWYNLHNPMFDMMEMILMTIIYESYLLISFERLSCVIMEIKYNYYHYGEIS